MDTSRETDLNTEQKIKEAARKVFLEKGFDGAKLKHIAQEADVNIALVNYYFRSKEQLYKSIFLEAFKNFFGTIYHLLNDELPLEIKIWKLIDRYTDFLAANPHLPLFVLSELLKGGGVLITDLEMPKLLKTSHFVMQLREEGERGTIRKVDPIQVLSTLIGTLVLPFMAKPIITLIADFENEEQFRVFLENRKTVVFEMVMGYLRSR
ncbi:TetR/AcrR family transcriptional regulator [Larkinella soli]|uniref:TetR/AcrR family transcriptional regulator n=1 Tax=Larkinella soli TaxID=1770527 RepID=UPI000FFC9120|nr:TetR/AcrR family transcriptional regulator [Larkinella soli]